MTSEYVGSNVDKICIKYLIGHIFSIYTSRLPASCCCGEVRTCHESWSWLASPPIKTLAREPASVELTTPTQVSWRGTVPRRGHSLTSAWSDLSSVRDAACWLCQNFNKATFDFQKTQKYVISTLTCLLKSCKSCLQVFLHVLLRSVINKHKSGRDERDPLSLCT